LIVKVMAKKLADGKYYKKKGVVRRVHEQYVGEIKMLNSSTVIKLDQAQLETVIPAVGKVLMK
jgi:DNA/RNA-binding protein KIN17